MDQDKWLGDAAQVDPQRRQEALKEHTQREARAARVQLWHTELILKRLGMEPQYCGTDLITPWLIATVKNHLRG